MIAGWSASFRYWSSWPVFTHFFVVFHEGLLVKAVPGVKLISGDGDDAVAPPLPLRLQAFVALRPGGYLILVQFSGNDQSALAVSQRIKNPAYRGSFRRMDDVAFFRSSVMSTALRKLEYFRKAGNLLLIYVVENRLS